MKKFAVGTAVVWNSCESKLQSACKKTNPKQQAQYLKFQAGSIV
jgi:hypothetical protein